MPVRQLNRQQTWLFPPTLDELIPDDHPTRFVAMIVDSLDTATWQKLNIELEGDPLGAPSYHPRAMLGVWLYGFMTGTRTNRKLEAACRDQIPYLWLTSWQHPDHNSLWRFYKAHRDEMRSLFKMTIKTAVKMDLVDMALQAVDGTKVVANAAKDRTYDEKGLTKLLERTDTVIQELEKENESGNDPPPVHLPEKLRRAEHLRTEVKAAMERLTEEETLKKVNLTDGDANLMKGRQGIVAGYNVQAVVSPLKAVEGKKTGGMIITAIDTKQSASDTDQLIPMLEQSKENTGKQAEISLADAGYHSSINLAECKEREQVIVMPESNEKALQNPYHKDMFSYDPAIDSYLCPCGQTLKYERTNLVRKTMMRIYRVRGAICRDCKAFGVCTKNDRNGRIIQIGTYDEILRYHRKWMVTDEAKELYSYRKELPEPVFGILKEQMGFRRFLLRGYKNVCTETILLATAFNLRTLGRIWRLRLSPVNNHPASGEASSRVTGAKEEKEVALRAKPSLSPQQVEGYSVANLIKGRLMVNVHELVDIIVYFSQLMGIKNYRCSGIIG